MVHVWVTCGAGVCGAVRVGAVQCVGGGGAECEEEETVARRGMARVKPHTHTPRPPPRT